MDEGMMILVKNAAMLAEALLQRGENTVEVVKVRFPLSESAQEVVDRLGGSVVNLENGSALLVLTGSQHIDEIGYHLRKR